MPLWSPFEEVTRDLRYSWKLHLRDPGFAALIIFTLALAIGANTAIFSIFDAVLLRPLPYRDPGSLVAVWDKPDGAADSVRRFNTYGDLEAYQANSQSFSEVEGASWAFDLQVMSGRGRARGVFVVPVTAGFFPMLGAKPALGRLFRPSDATGGCAVILSYQLWQKAFGSDPKAAGSSVRLGDENCVVMAVMPAGFAFFPSDTDLWTLVTTNSAISRDPNRYAMGIFGRLKPGKTIRAASSELHTLHTLAHVHDRHARHNGPRLFPLDQNLTSIAGPNLRLSLFVLFASVLAVLIIACVNVASLLLGRSLGRQKELTIRAALGSGRFRLVRQLLTESLLLSMTAAVVGCGLAGAAIHYFRVVNPIDLPPGKPVEINLPVLGFTAALSIFTTLAFGLLPAWRSSRSDWNPILKTGGSASAGTRRRRQLGQSVVVFEVMLSLALLVSAGLLIRSVAAFSSAPLGFAPGGILKLTVLLPPSHYPSAATRRSYLDRAADRLGTLPELHGVAFTSAIPSVGGSGSGLLSLDGRPEPEHAANDTGSQFVSPNYFRLLQVSLLRGREFNASDGQNSEAVTIINKTLADKYFPHTDAVGHHLQFRSVAGTDQLLIVGVVADEKHISQGQEMNWDSTPLLYRPIAQAPPAHVNVLALATNDSDTVAERVRQELASLDPSVPVFDVETLRHYLGQYSAYPEFRAQLLSVFAGLALLFSVVGLYGVLSQLVEQRTQEIGVRVALGAQPHQILVLVLGNGMLLAGGGIGLGLIASWLSTRLITSLLYGVRTTDPLTFIAVSLLLAGAAFAGMYLPARRATRLQPIKALRYE